MNSALGSVYKAYMLKQQAVPETALGDEFQSWADDMVEGTWATSDDSNEQDQLTTEVVDRYDQQADFVDDVTYDDSEEVDPDQIDPDEKSAEEESLELQFLKKLSGIK